MTAHRSRLLVPLLGGAALVLLRLVASAYADEDNVAIAAAHSDATQVRQLIAGGTSPNELDDSGRTGLQLAAINGNLQIAAILLKAQARVDLKDKLGNTALHYAADHDHGEMVQLLLDVGAAVDPENKDGMTPLMIAASRGSATIVQALLAKGANIRRTDYTGRDALSWATESHRPVVVQLLQHALAQH